MLKQRRAKLIKSSTALYGEIVVVFLLGALFASSIHYFLSHYRRTYRKPVETKTVVNLQGKSSSQRFHQRRRRI